MPFPTRWRREEDLWFACLFRGAAKGAGSLMIFFSLAPLWMPPQPPPPAYSCGGTACARNLNEAAGPAAGSAPRRGGQPAARLRQAAAPQLAARLLRALHGPNAGSHDRNGLIRGTANPLPTLFSLGQLDGHGVRWQPVWP